MALSGPDLQADWLFNWGNAAQLGAGIGLTAVIALVSAAASAIGGTGFGFVLASKHRWVRGAGRVYLEAVRIIPLVVLLYVAYYLASAELGLNTTNVVTSIIIFTAWGTGEFGDIVRGAITSIPSHQYESARALGMSPARAYLSVIVPQSVRRVAPAAMNLVTRMIKTTSLCAFISVAEVMTIGRQIVSVANQSFHHPEAPFVVYGIVMALYFLVCWPIARAATRLEKVWAV
ncbi:MAG: amino acid ABC transporter permease [Bifidobacteriaceae bacterium]|jgi:polar amino acid transport system permease protein|nr:amino acid ABC transporter permease [Bifidobacteriaceae bacterium]